MPNKQQWEDDKTIYRKSTLAHSLIDKQAIKDWKTSPGKSRRKVKAVYPSNEISLWEALADRKR